MEAIAKTYWVAFAITVSLVFAHQVWRARRPGLANPLGTYLALTAAAASWLGVIQASGAKAVDRYRSVQPLRRRT